MLDYGVKDIKTLEGIEAIRLRPGMYIGSTGPDGVKHITLEIISNVVDEYLNEMSLLCAFEGIFIYLNFSHSPHIDSYF